MAIKETLVLFVTNPAIGDLKPQNISSFVVKKGMDRSAASLIKRLY